MIDLAVREATGLALLERRGELGLSQLELAHRAGLTQAAIARLELGKQPCTLEQLALLARTMKITRVEFFERIEAARKLLRQPNARRLYLAGRTRARAPQLRT